MADRVFALEVAAAAGVVERLIESELNGRFRFPVRGGLDERVIEIRGKTDRIDVLDDGTLRVIDYKLGRMPDLDSSVQIGVYAHCARQWIEQRDGRSHPVSAASYLAFGDDHKFEGKLARTARRSRAGDPGQGWRVCHRGRAHRGRGVSAAPAHTLGVSVVRLCWNLSQGIPG